MIENCTRAHQEHDLTAETAAATSPNTEVTSCVFNHNSQMCVASGSDGKVRIFDLRRRQGECIGSWSVSDQPTTQGGTRGIPEFFFYPFQFVNVVDAVPIQFSFES